MLTANGSMDNFLQLMGALGIFIFVLALTFFVTRWIGNYQQTQWKNRNMQIIETMRIANNKFIQIVKVAEEYLVIAVGKDSIELLMKLDADKADKLKIPEGVSMESFQDILKKFKAKKK